MIRIRLLSKEDDVSAFDCGVVDLNQYLKLYAKQHRFRHYIGTNFVALMGDEIVGYVSVSASSIRGENLSSVVRKKLPRYPLPILRLTRFAVDTKYQRQKIGYALLRFVLNLILEQNKSFGCFGLVVDAKESSVSYYTQFGFVAFDLQAGALDIRPFAQSLFLATKTIEKGLGR